MTTNQSSSAPTDIFATTHWTVVLAAGQRHSPRADHALEELCHTCWFPLYAYIRRRGHTKEDAQDLTRANRYRNFHSAAPLLASLAVRRHDGQL